MKNLLLIFIFSVNLFCLQTIFAVSVTNQFHGLNWADTRDNYNAGWVIPSGLLSSDNYQLIEQKAKQILSAFQTNLQANTVRLPINGPTVLESWWGSYSAAFDVAVSMNLYVVVSYWESDTAKDGRIDNLQEFWKMWEVVTNQYLNTDLVYFEIFNEPFGYSNEEWINLAAEFLLRFPTIPQKRIIVSGVGYNDHLSPVGYDSRLQNCLLSLHIYAFWNENYVTAEAWSENFRSRVGAYYSRAIVSEYGVPMSTGLNYTGPINNDSSIAFMYGVPDQIRAYSMGSIYWPGLRDGDYYSVQSRSGDETNIQLTVTNPSGVERIHVAYVSVTGKRGAGIPIVLLHDATGGTLTIELKNGCTYRGILEDAQDNMNIMLKDCVKVSPEGLQSRIETVYIRGSQISFIILPSMLQKAPFFNRIKMFRKFKGHAVYGANTAAIAALSAPRGGRGIFPRPFRGGGGGRGDPRFTPYGPPPGGFQGRPGMGFPPPGGNMGYR